MRRRTAPGRRRREQVLLTCCYALFALSGLLALFLLASPILLSQGGRVIVDVWGGFCLVGGLGGVIGLVWPLALVETVGVILLSSASLTWTVSLILQAVTAGTTVPLTAASIAGALTAKLAHRALIVISHEDR